MSDRVIMEVSVPDIGPWTAAPAYRGDDIVERGDRARLVDPGDGDRWTHLELDRSWVPLALADLHRALPPDATCVLRMLDDRTGTGRTPGRWAPGQVEEVCEAAGFTVASTQGPGDADRHPGELVLGLRRADTLADTVGPGMRLLVCGLNPSPASAAAGVGFARPGNRFWPAARAAGLVEADRDPRRALTDRHVGMTDLVKRVTRRADELDPDEYRVGLERLERLVAWLSPRAVCFVGLAGWRAAVDRRAAAGVQHRRVGGRPVYVMPSTSGLNAHATPETLADHLRAAARLADEGPDPIDASGPAHRRSRADPGSTS